MFSKNAELMNRAATMQLMREPLAGQSTTDSLLPEKTSAMVSEESFYASRVYSKVGIISEPSRERAPQLAPHSLTWLSAHG
jgi:hypothetical protein